ncbi:hypothetical protein PC110_g411 [Phytophthora cactorum]|uniref:Uncharacterized protein n=1 Tax=Phytophthora cactorum TaxID=29920 RepID=A0A329T2I9_9STRA|nr:hypothetical protein PC117_g18738 [Phytophthora cactorum]KAG3022231.1 hypothetical protein PC119_g9360 [Phytophthora cactorum]RAW43467.1 hypothetical protein PC110_g411 [Phytophthora cactorum]
MRDLGRLRLTDIRELEEVLVDLPKGEERLVARGAIQQSWSVGDSYRRGDTRSRSRSRSKSRAEQDRSNHRKRRDYDSLDRRKRREQGRPREDMRRASRVTFADAAEQDWVAELNGRGCKASRATVRRDASSVDDFVSSCSDGSSSSDSLRQLAAAIKSERRSIAEGTYTRNNHRPRRNKQTGRGDDRERREVERGGRENRRRSFGPCAACGG